MVDVFTKEGGVGGGGGIDLTASERSCVESTTAAAVAPSLSGADGVVAEEI